MAEETPTSAHKANEYMLDVEDIRRARELYRHVQPYHLLPGSSEHTHGSADGAMAATALGGSLEPYVQLASMRCESQRAFITLIDRDLQHCLVEVARQADGTWTQPLKKCEPMLWLGYGGVPKSGKLCEMTIQLSPIADPYPVFQVSDLAQDHRFSQLPFVQGGPQLRFYAGTPLTTKKGINIGSLCVMDAEPREGLNLEQTRVLGWLAGLVVTHLETNREAIEGRRSKLMSDALKVFVDGGSSMETLSGNDSRGKSAPSEPPRRTSLTCATNAKSDGVLTSKESPAIPQRGNPPMVEDGSQDSYPSMKERTSTSSDPSSDEEDFKGARQDEAVSESHSFTFGRAANILRECFEMDGRDGVLFLEAATGLTYMTGSGPDTNTNGDILSIDGQPDTLASPTHQIGTNTSFDPLISAFTKHPKDPTPILAASSKHEPFHRGQCPGGNAALGEIDQDVLRELFKRYPQGKIWILEDGALSLCSEDDQLGKDAHRTSLERRKLSHHRKGELSLMVKLFPGVRQLLFVPLWDAGASRWASGCFAWSTSDTRVFSTAIDLSFLSAFGATIMAECSRLDTLLADKQKADFIGSVSHELRSPLHGILAGAEFLAETATSAFQRTLIDTVEACGRTLLDTINHVLDFSKINSLDRNWRNNRQPRKRLAEGRIGHGAKVSAKQVPHGAPPLLRLYAVTDIAAIAEEVLEGVSVGQIYNQATDLTDISAGNRGCGLEHGLKTVRLAHREREDEKQPRRPDIEVLVDIAKEDWVFMAQPGAIRRIIMNLFGNSIKYTSSGTIKVQLRLENVPGSDPDHEGKIMVLTVSDTGKGIAAKFLSSRLFVPFAQENTLSPGTGLGLSIVRSIVTMMGGNIDLRSKVGEGTTVQVSLPLMRPSAGSQPTQSTAVSTSTGATSDDLLRSLRAEAAGCVVAIHAYHEFSEMTARTHEYSRVLARYVEDWYELEVCDWAHRDKATILIIDEKELPIVHGGMKAGSEGNVALIVMCSNAKRHSEVEADTSKSRSRGVLEYVSKPCGPYKLARTLRVCLRRMLHRQSAHLHDVDGSLIPSETQGSGEPNLSDQGGEKASIPVQANGGFSESPYSRNAPVIISHEAAGGKKSGNEFPFLSDSPCSTVSPLSPGVQKLSHWTNNGLGASPFVEAKDGEPRILLVDDNKINLQLLQTFMRQQKYNHVDSAENGQVAVNAVQAAKKPYDIILMDISMPVMNGFDATRAIRSFEADKKQKRAMIIALTGLANRRDQAEGFTSGCDIYMTKPVSFKELAKLFKNWQGNLDGIRYTGESQFCNDEGGVAKVDDAG